MNRRLRPAIVLGGLALLIAIGTCASSLRGSTGAAVTRPTPSPAVAATVATESVNAAVPALARTHPEVSAGSLTSAPACDRELQSIVDEAPAGATVRVPACIYRETITLSRPIALVAEAGAEIRGSDIWTDWSRRDGLWIRDGLPALSGSGACLDERDCQPPYQIFLDGVALERVGGRPAAGQFTVRGSEVRLADDPTNRTVEVSTRTRWVVGRANDVRIEGFKMRHAANPAQNGALHTDGHSRWSIVRNVLSNAHGPIVSIHGGVGHILHDNDISRSGQLGVHGTAAARVLVQGNRIHDNNLAGFDPVWEAGGLKMTAMSDLTVVDNEVSHNDGWGLWCDIDCRDVTFARNRVHHNTWIGISYEISRRGTITGNVIWENGLGAAGWGKGAGILCQNCAATTISENLVAWCPDGITVIEQEREIISRVEDVVVRGNTIVGADGTVALGWLTDRSPEYLFRPTARNQGVDNRYWFASREGRSERFAWDGPRRRLTSFNATPGEEGGRYLQDAEKARILTAVGIPLEPDSRR